MVEFFHQWRDDLPVLFITPVWSVQTQRSGAFAQLRAADRPRNGMVICPLIGWSKINLSVHDNGPKVCSFHQPRAPRQIGRQGDDWLVG